MYGRFRRSFIVVLATLLVVGLIGCTALPAAGAQGGTKTEAEQPSVDNATNGSVKPPQNDALQPGEGDVERVFFARFVTNSGTAVATMETTVIETEPVTTRANYNFVGWYLTEDFSDSRVEFPYRLTADTTFYAKWLTTDTIIIRTAQEFQDIHTNEEWMGNYALGNNIDLQGVEWTPVGDRQNPFSGTFDGNGYTVFNLNLEPTEVDEEYNYISVGLFGHVTGRISNLNLADYHIFLDGGFSRFYIGGLAGWAEKGAITNCTARGNIVNPALEYEGDIWDDFFGSYADPTSLTYFGGLIGRIDSANVTRCNASGTITSKSVEDTVYGGGLAGYNEEGTVSECFAQVNVEARMAGGLLGYNNGTVRSCFAVGNQLGSLSYPAIAGGLVGFNDTMGAISRSYATGTVTARTAGGLVGVNMFSYLDPVGGSILNSYATGNVTAAEYGGGLIGRAEAEIPVKGSADYHPSITSNYYFIAYCFAYGNVTVDVRDVYYVEDGNGSHTGTQGVYHSVFAGGLIGHATEPLMRSVVAFGNVTARSTRPISGSDDQVYNSVYADNVIGQNTALLPTSNHIYALDEQQVMRNDMIYSGFNSAPVQTYATLNGYNFLRTTMGFDANIWNLNNIDFEAGRIPTLL